MGVWLWSFLWLGRHSCELLLLCQSRLVDQAGEDVSDVSAVLADYRDGVAAVVLAQEGSPKAEAEGLADRGAVVDQAEVHRHREGHHQAGLWVLVAQVVLDMPVVGVRKQLVEHVLDWL